MKRLVGLGLLLAVAACAQQSPPPAPTAPPPPAAAAPPPQVAAMPPPTPAPPPRASRTSFDGLYSGTVVQEAYGGSTQELTGGNCDPQLSMNMRVKRGYVRIWYKNYVGHTLHYRGRVNSDGTVETSHTNRGGEGAILALQISGNQATGNLERGRCWYQVTLTKT
jgi:hypothetical protein